MTACGNWSGQLAGAVEHGPDSQAPRRPVRMVHQPLPAWARHLHLTPALDKDPA